MHIGWIDDVPAMPESFPPGVDLFCRDFATSFLLGRRQFLQSDAFDGIPKRILGHFKVFRVLKKMMLTPTPPPSDLKYNSCPRQPSGALGPFTALHARHPAACEWHIAASHNGTRGAAYDRPALRGGSLRFLCCAWDSAAVCETGCCLKKTPQS